MWTRSQMCYIDKDVMSQLGAKPHGREAIAIMLWIGSFHGVSRIAKNKTTSWCCPNGHHGYVPISWGSWKTTQASLALLIDEGLIYCDDGCYGLTNPKHVTGFRYNQSKTKILSVCYPGALSPGALCIYAFMQRSAFRSHVFFGSTDKLAEMFRTYPTQIRAWQNELTSIGLIRILSNGRGRCSKRRIQLPEGWSATMEIQKTIANRIHQRFNGVRTRCGKTVLVEPEEVESA